MHGDWTRQESEEEGRERHYPFHYENGASVYKVRQHLVNTVGLNSWYELRFQCELTLQTQLKLMRQPRHVHKVLPDLVYCE